MDDCIIVQDFFAEWSETFGRWCIHAIKYETFFSYRALRSMHYPGRYDVIRELGNGRFFPSPYDRHLSVRTVH